MRKKPHAMMKILSNIMTFFPSDDVFDSEWFIFRNFFSFSFLFKFAFRTVYLPEQQVTIVKD